ncbi:MAG: type IV toxin-antitoxin system AbiEi family antitoxin domain-containing protein [Oligoflexus sp.]
MGATKPLLAKLKSRKVMKASELAPYISTRTQLRRMVEAGKLIALGSGIYAHPTLDPFTASLIAAAKYYPTAVISNITALVIHGLSDERVDRIDVDIPRNSSIRNRLLCTHRVPDHKIVGAIKLDYNGHKIRVYCQERALCDAYRIDPDGPIFLKAMKRYVKNGGTNADLIAEYDEVVSTNVLRSLRQELADG